MKVEIEARPVGEAKEQEKEYGKFDKWEIESAVDCLLRAEEIKADEEKMKYVKPLLEKRAAQVQKAAAAITSVDQLRDVAKKRLSKKD